MIAFGKRYLIPYGHIYNQSGNFSYCQKYYYESTGSVSQDLCSAHNFVLSVEDSNANLAIPFTLFRGEGSSSWLRSSVPSNDHDKLIV